MNGKEDSPALNPFQGINLTYREEGVVQDKGPEIFKGTPYSASLVHFESFLISFSGAHADSPGHVNVAS